MLNVRSALKHANKLDILPEYKSAIEGGSFTRIVRARFPRPRRMHIHICRIQIDIYINVQEWPTGAPPIVINLSTAVELECWLVK